MPSYLDLVYYGNYAGSVTLRMLGRRLEYWTFFGEVYLADYERDYVTKFESPLGC